MLFGSYFLDKGKNFVVGNVSRDHECFRITAIIENEFNNKDRLLVLPMHII